MKKLILFFVVVLIVGCSKDDEGSRSTDPFIGSWAFVNGDGITGDLTVRDNGTFTISYPDDWDSPTNGSWINISTEPDFNSRTQTYTTNITRTWDDPEETTIIFSTDFNSFTVVGVEFVRK